MNQSVHFPAMTLSARHHGLDGDTQLIAHIGYPTGAFKAPMIYNPYFESLGLNAAVVPMGVKGDDLAAAFPAIMRLSNVVGALITMPHKVGVTSMLDEVSTAARIAGSCNAVRRLADGRLGGDMFDGEGFVRGVLAKGRAVRGAAVLIVGCGGVGSAIAAAFAAAGAARISLFDTDEAGMRGLAERLALHYPALGVTAGSRDPDGHAIVVNATPLGMKADDPPPLDVARVAPTALVGDVVMASEMTPLLAAARARGCEVQIGLDMLFEQIPAYLAFFGYPVATPARLRELARINY
jgi:shikimate dehydrogenase